MEVVDLSISKKEEEANRTDFVGDVLRNETVEFAKKFKTSWLNLGRHLYAIYQDKLFYGWGYNKFEDYTEQELGLKKSLCSKLLRAYLFIEQDEPVYLDENYIKDNEPVKVPGYDAVDVLRMAKGKRELTKDDYSYLRGIVFDKGKDVGEVRKELTALMKERKPIDPEEEREKRNTASIKKVLNALTSFKQDMDVLKLISPEVVEKTDALIENLTSQLS